MVLEWYWMALLGFIMLILGLYAVWKTELQGPSAGLKGRMQDFAKRAVETAAKEHHIQLDYSQASIESVDSILDTIAARHKRQEIPEKELSQIVLTWGGYVGTTLIKMVGGQWRPNSPVAGNNTYPIFFSNRKAGSESTQPKLAEATPVIWCLKRIRRGTEESVAAKFRKAVEG